MAEYNDTILFKVTAALFNAINDEHKRRAPSRGARCGRSVTIRELVCEALDAQPGGLTWRQSLQATQSKLIARGKEVGAPADRVQDWSYQLSRIEQEMSWYVERSMAGEARDILPGPFIGHDVS